MLDFAGTGCMTTGNCTSNTTNGTTSSSGGGSASATAVGSLTAVPTCYCNGYPAASQKVCMKASCTSYDCACPVGQALLFSGNCSSISYVIDTTASAATTFWNASQGFAADIDDVCGPGSQVDSDTYGYYRCQCTQLAPFVQFVNKTNVVYKYGCDPKCEKSLPASLDAFNNLVCPQTNSTGCVTPVVKDGLCQCYFDGGYANLNGVCTKCSE